MADPIYVVDASVVVPWFFTDEPRRADALRVRDAIRDTPARFVVPPLFHSELVHVLARKSGKDEAFVREGLRLVMALGLRTVALPETALLRTAHWSCVGLGGYDSTYAALAEDLGGRWLTADERAAKITGRSFGTTLSAWVRTG